MENSIARKYIIGVDVHGVPLEIRDESPRFLYQKNSRCHVPWMQPEFPETVDPSTRQIGQIESGGTAAANALNPQYQPGEMVQIIPRIRSTVIGESGCQDAVVEI